MKKSHLDDVSCQIESASESIRIGATMPQTWIQSHRHNMFMCYGFVKDESIKKPLN